MVFVFLRLVWCGVFFGWDKWREGGSVWLGSFVVFVWVFCFFCVEIVRKVSIEICVYLICGWGLGIFCVVGVGLGWRSCWWSVFLDFGCCVGIVL